VAYALAYPAINAVQHGGFLRIPTFGVPCPTTILTVGLLMLTSPRWKSLGIVPIIWSVIGGSAACLLGVSADYALPIAGAALAVFHWQDRVRDVWELARGHAPLRLPRVPEATVGKRSSR